MLLIAGCTEADASPAPAASATERVESGVTIVDNPTRLVDSASWRIDTVPLVSIGESDGDPNYIIGRLGGYLRRPDGTILVGDAVSATVRLYDAQGRFLRTIGRAGDGPGEYRVLAALFPYVADSVIVVDYEGGRMNVLDPQLEYVRSFRVTLKDGRPESYMTSHSLGDGFSDGHLLMKDYLGTCNRRRIENGFCEDSTAFFRTTFDGVPAARYGRFVSARDERFRVAVGFTTSWGEPHPQTYWDIHDDRFYFADSRRLGYRVYGPTGALERVVRAPHDNERFEKQEVFPKPEPAGEELDLRTKAAIRVRTAAQEKAALPDSFPQFSDMLVDTLGHVWLREYEPPVRLRGVNPRWLVFDSTGHLVHVVRSPRGMMRWVPPWAIGGPQIGRDYILTHRRDADGVESVVMYRLERGAQTALDQ